MSIHHFTPHPAAFSCRMPAFQRRLAALLALSLLSVPSFAVPLYDSGTLDFTSTGQSMWGPGSSFQASNSVFVGAQWQNQTVGLGGFVGELSTTTVNTNPAWWAWYGCKNTINVFCGDQPSKGQVKVVTDTRTGARVDLTTSGKFGLNFGYTIDSGTVDANVKLTANAVLPDKGPHVKEYFNLNPSSSLDDGTLTSQSPKAEATVDAIAQLSGSVKAKACLILAGCTGEGTYNFPSLDANLPLLALDPNSLKVLPDLLPGASPSDPRLAFAEVPIANQGLTLEGALSVTGVPGYKLSTPQFTLASTVPPAPALNVDLASLSFQLPDIQTNGGVSGASLKSSGSSNVLSAKIDLDGIAAMAGFPPTGIGVDLIDAGGFKVSAQFDALDIDAGPDLGLRQDFELKPTLMVHLDFDNPVLVSGYAAPQTFWEGRWSELPDFALLRSTTFTPTYWLDAELTNQMAIDLGLSGTMDILKFTFGASAGGVNIIGTNPISLNSLLGLGNDLFPSQHLTSFQVGNLSFGLQGFNTIAGTPFTVTVPEPGTIALFLIGFGSLVLMRRRKARTDAGHDTDMAA